MTTSAKEEQKLRRRLAGSTTEVTNYRDWAVNDLALEARGRHATKSNVVGAKAVPLYPAASGPWNDPVQVPDEPPIGIDVSYVEPCGEIHEIEESLKAVSSVLSPEDAAAATASTIPSPGAKEASAVSTSAADASTPIPEVAAGHGDKASLVVQADADASEAALLRRARKL